MDSSAGASVAVVDTTPDDPRVLARWETQDTRAHAEVLSPAVESVMVQADLVPESLGGILVGTGPGPFTGLRAGLATARTLGFVWDLPVHGLCSLEAIAHDVASLPATARPDEFAVVTDARRREVYWATYGLVSVTGSVANRAVGNDDVRARLLNGPHVGPAREVPELPVFGRGAGLYPEVLRAPEVGFATGREPETGGQQGRGEPPDQWQPAAASLGLAAAAVVNSGGQLSRDTSPLYLRESDAKVPGPRKKATT